MLQNDKWIITKAQQGMIEPFNPECVRKTGDIPIISWGLGSFGYDVRLASHDFRLLKKVPGQIIDPKDFDPQNLEQAKLHHGDRGDYFVIPANSYGLGVSLETITMPHNVTALCIGKSTYSRVGVIANLTPLECSWQGKITLELSNSSSADVKVYSNEGIVQLLFFLGENCRTTYADRKGKYQNQGNEVTLARV